MMSMQSRNQYLYTLIKNNGGYHLKSKKEKSKILNQYCSLTGQNRKYVIRKIKSANYIVQERKVKEGRQRNRQSYYDNQVIPALIKCWKIFDRPCGQRLEPLLKIEVDRLRQLKELPCSDTVAQKLKQIGSRTIDQKLKSHKEEENLKRVYDYKNNPLLYQKIPIKLSTEWNRNQFGNIQIDLVEHCGQANQGEFVHTLSTTDIATGWWEGQAQLNRGQMSTMKSLKTLRKRYPFAWKAIHFDNDSAFINWQLYYYAEQENLKFSRSRPYHKNDNCFVEQKNGFNVRRSVGHYRYDTKKELQLLNDLYQNELRLFKNFFQPVVKLIKKERIGGHIKRKYDQGQTPYLRIMKNPRFSKQEKEKLREIYQSLNPAQLKRDIDTKYVQLKKLYLAKQHSNTKTLTNLNTNMVTFLNCTTSPFRLPS